GPSAPSALLTWRKTKKAARGRGLERRVLAPESQALDDLLILGRLGGLQVVEELAALVHELHQPATRRMVTLVCAEVVAETVDTLGEQGDLDFRRAGVVGGATELRDYTGFLFSGERHLCCDP